MKFFPSIEDKSC